MKSNLNAAGIREQIFAFQMYPVLADIEDLDSQMIAINIVCNRYSIYTQPESAARISQYYGVHPALATVLTRDERVLLKGMIDPQYDHLVERLL